jgi:hypothetical protein
MLDIGYCADFFCINSPFTSSFFTAMCISQMMVITQNSILWLFGQIDLLLWNSMPSEKH